MRTLKPETAATWAMPPPIWPEPMMPMVLIGVLIRGGYRGHGGAARGMMRKRAMKNPGGGPGWWLALDGPARGGSTGWKPVPWLRAAGGVGALEADEVQHVEDRGRGGAVAVGAGAAGGVQGLEADEVQDV